MKGAGSIANLSTQVAGDDAVERNISDGVALSELLQTTLGPMGSDKMLVGGGEALVTNKGHSIIERMEIESPAATLVARLARAQHGELGDGSTSVVVLAGALLDEAVSLLNEGCHPTTVVRGYTEAADRARSRLDEYTVGRSMDAATRRSVVETTITGRWDDGRTDRLADLVARSHEAIRDRAQGSRHDVLTIHGVAGGDVGASELLDGLVIDTGRSSTTLSDVPAPVPTRIDDATVAVLDDECTIRTPESVSRYTFDDPDAVERARAFESSEYERDVDVLRTNGVDVLFCQKSIDDRLRTLLARDGILAFERTRQDEVHKLERATGAVSVMRLDDLGPASTGHADTVERRRIGGSSFVLVRNAASTQFSVLLRGGTEHVVDETERIVADGLAVLEIATEYPGLVPGGGAAEVALARDLRSHARTIGDREALAVTAFADAVESIPVALARNAGANPVDVLTELRRRQTAGETTVGVDATTGTVSDAAERGLLEPARLKGRIVANATQVATFLLRIDEVIETDGPLDSDVDHNKGDDHGHGHGGAQGSTDGYPWAIGH